MSVGCAQYDSPRQFVLAIFTLLILKPRTVPLELDRNVVRGELEEPKSTKAVVAFPNDPPKRYSQVPKRPGCTQNVRLLNVCQLRSRAMILQDRKSVV